MLKIGLTGGIGSGKTEISNLLSSLGVKIIDTDVISRSLTNIGGKAIPFIENDFGKRSICKNGEMNRDWMRKQIFYDNKKREKLNNIMHPLIIKEVRCMVNDDTNLNSKYLVIVIPLLVENYLHWYDLINSICVVYCDVKTQISRVINRSNLKESIVKRIISSQVDYLSLIKSADYIVNNGYNVTLEQLKTQIIYYHQIWCNIA